MSGWHKMIHHGLISLFWSLWILMFWSNLCHPLDILTVALNFSLSTQTFKCTTGLLSEYYIPVSPQRFLSITANSDKHVPSRVSTTEESRILPRGELSCINLNSVMPDDYWLLQARASALIKHSRPVGCLRYGFSNLINIEVKSSAQFTALQWWLVLK